MSPRYHGDFRLDDALPPLRVAVDTTMVVAGAFATRDYSPLHHDARYAREQAGHADVFLNTPTQLALFERYLAGCFGSAARIGRLKSRMHVAVCAGSEIVIAGRVTAIAADDAGCGWLEVLMTVTAGDTVATRCEARLALPRSAADNPWHRRGAQWRP